MEIIHIFNPESIANAYADAAGEAQELHMMFNRLLDKIRHYENYADIEGRKLTYDEICACKADAYDKCFSVNDTGCPYPGQ